MKYASELTTYLGQAGVPARYFKDTDPTKYPVPVDGLVKTMEKRGVYIYGGVGSGKTQLAVDLISQYAQACKKEIVVGEEEEYKDDIVVFKDKTALTFDPKLFYFFNVPALLIKIRSLFSDSANETLDQLLSDLDQYEYLILDDLGAEKPTEWVLEILYVLVNNRYENLQKLIVTSNKSPQEIAEVVGDRIASRLREMCKTVKMTGEDQRQKS